MKLTDPYPVERIEGKGNAIAIFLIIIFLVAIILTLIF
jgi:hypothetical protein